MRKSTLRTGLTVKKNIVRKPACLRSHSNVLKEAVHADASLTQVGERQMSNAGPTVPLCRSFALSLALQALNGTPQSEVTPRTSRLFVRAAGSIEL
ncbi:jg16252 [Pararge aegeria aegeria]|uniref:Jg16252 protein n=1 Tax=Pararge aegeria aegeria TaxID=348720 RepID=A0A8S4RU64_9NEOP|nr:jg16252 [Pararge aegeria aegeria]